MNKDRAAPLLNYYYIRGDVIKLLPAEFPFMVDVVFNAFSSAVKWRLK
jgi:hypothetical protein